MLVTLNEMDVFGLGDLLLLLHSGGVLYLRVVPKSLLDNMLLIPPRNSQKWCVVRIALLYCATFPCSNCYNILFSFNREVCNNS